MEEEKRDLILEENIKNKVKIYFDSDQKVHIILKFSGWLNGKIVLIKEDHFILEEDLKFRKILFYKEVLDIAEYMERK